MNPLAPIANRVWYLANLPAYQSFRKALLNPRATQEKILRRYLRTNANTAFGRSHHFDSIISISEFQGRLPLTTYDDYAPYIDRIMCGEPNVLTRDSVKCLEPSSGSTRAAKLIPYTAGLQREFNAAIAPWIVDLYRRRPWLMNGTAYWSISPATPPPPTAAHSKIPIGFEDDSAYLGALLKPLVDATLAVPSSVRRIPDIEAFRFQTLLHLLAANDLRLISVWHPSFLSLLLDTMKVQWQPLLRALAERGRRARARELEPLDPRDYLAIWPRLSLISAWGDAHAALHLRDLQSRWPALEHQPKGLIATEAFITLPFENQRPLAIRSHFFEFLDENNHPRLAHELRPHRTYRLVITTAGGLYRYQLHDQVQVKGFLANTPSLRFLGKQDHVSDRFGEKLTEGFVAKILQNLLGARPPKFAMLAPHTNNGTTRYVLYIEADLHAEADLACILDRALHENPHYAYCRKLNQLAPAAIQLVTHATQTYLRRRQSQGQRLGNIKPAALSNLDDWDQWFDLKTD